MSVQNTDVTMSPSWRSMIEEKQPFDDWGTSLFWMQSRPVLMNGWCVRELRHGLASAGHIGCSSENLSSTISDLGPRARP